MSPRRRGSESADVAYLRPIVERLGAEEVHRLVNMIALEVGGNGGNGDPKPKPKPR